MVIVDTNIVIDHLRQKKINNLSILEQAISQNPKEIFAISILSIQELYVGESSRNPKNEKLIQEILGHLIILNYSIEIAILSGRISRDLKRIIEKFDAAIAATSIYHQAKLFTLNLKHFSDIPKLQFAKLKN